jgi:hypothetical protein
MEEEEDPPYVNPPETPVITITPTLGDTVHIEQQFETPVLTLGIWHSIRNKGQPKLEYQILMDAKQNPPPTIAKICSIQVEWWVHSKKINSNKITYTGLTTKRKRTNQITNNDNVQHPHCGVMGQPCEDQFCEMFEEQKYITEETKQAEQVCKALCRVCNM